MAHLSTVCLFLVALTKGITAEDFVRTYNKTTNGITKEYAWHNTQTDWKTANETCSSKDSQLYCYCSDGHCDLPDEIFNGLNTFFNQMWLQRLECSKPIMIGLYVEVTMNLGKHHYEPLFNDSKQLQFVCMRQITPIKVEPPTLQVPLHNVSCPRTFHRNLEWQNTPGNTTLFRSCPNGRIGIASWFCNKDGMWTPKHPDLSECVNPSINTMYETIGIKDLVDTVNDLQSLLKDMEHFYGGSLKMAIEILETVDTVSRAHIARVQSVPQKQKYVVEVATAVVDASNKLLENDRVWDDLSEKEKNGSANQLLTAIEETSSLILTNIPLNRKEVFAADNIALEVLKRPRGSFQNQNLTFLHGTLKNQTLGEVTLSAGFEQPGTNETEITFTWYSDLRHVLPRQYQSFSNDGANLTLNSAVVGARISGLKTHSPLNRQVDILLEHIDEALSPVCVFWNGAQWSNKGCKLLDTNKTHTMCRCDHLTNFAILMDVKCITCNADAAHLAALHFVSSIGCFISIFFLAISIFIFTWYRALWGIRTTIHRNLCISLLLAQVILVAGIERTEDETTCAVIAGLLHYFFLAVFFWMLLEGIQILLLLIQVFTSDDIKTYPYYIVGYGCPAIIVGITAGARPYDYGGRHFCWLNTDISGNGTIWAYLAPVAIIILFNTFALGYALFMTHRITKVTTTGIDNLKLWVRGSAVLMPILGLTWSVGFLYLVTDSMAIPYIFTVLNSIQGFGIFIFHCLLNKKVQHLIQHSVRRHHTQSMNITRSQSSSKGSRSSDHSKFWIRKPSVQKPSVLSDATPVQLVAIDPEKELPKSDAEIEPTETTSLKGHVDT